MSEKEHLLSVRIIIESCLYFERNIAASCIEGYCVAYNVRPLDLSSELKIIRQSHTQHTFSQIIILSAWLDGIGLTLLSFNLLPTIMPCCCFFFVVVLFY